MISVEIRAAIDRGCGKRDVRFVVIHTEGDGVNSDTSWAAIRRAHMLPKAIYDVAPNGKKTLRPGTGGNGWTDGGYNLWIRMSGLVEMGRPFERIPSHVAGFNPQSFGIGLAGDGNVADFTLAQYDSLFEVSWLLASRLSIPWEHFIGHREAPKFGAPWTSKNCPGAKVDLDKFRAMLAEPR